MVVDLTAVSGSGAPSLSGMGATAASGASMVIMVVSFIIVVGGIAAILLVLSRYKTKIPVIEITPSGLVLKHIRVMKKKESEGSEAAFRYQLFMKKITVPILTSPGDIYLVDLKGNFIPARIDNIDNLIKVKPADIEFWNVNQLQEAHTAYGSESFWQKYGAMVTGGIMLIVMLIAVIVIMTKLQDITTGLNAVAEAYRSGKVVLTLPAGQ
jgi:hypothetical protein